jgi:hypothetical protein
MINATDEFGVDNVTVCSLLWYGVHCGCGLIGSLCSCKFSDDVSVVEVIAVEGQ